MVGKTKVLFSSNLVPDKQQRKFRVECRKFYITAANCLKENLPFNVTLIKYVQYVHPEKHTFEGVTNAVSSIALKVANVLSKCLSKAFSVPQSDSKDVCDKIWRQWKAHQLKDISTYFYLKDNLRKLSTHQIYSHWSYALELYDLYPNT